MSENCWFTSDEHFGHDNIIKFCNRPFKDTSEMREALIKNHNSVVRNGDRVYHLGDMFWNTVTENEALAILHRLNGQHFYIMGNHEKIIKQSKPVRDFFVWVRDVDNLQVKGYPNIWLSHFAHRVWNGSHKRAFHLYGHTHNDMPEDGSLSFDVGVDAQHFYPISLNSVYNKMERIAEHFKGKQFVCKKCDNKFVPFHNRPTICSKCGEKMELK